MARGALITIEGLDGAGKSTLAAGLHADLRARGVDVRLLREPGGVHLSERIRALVTDPALAVGARAEALLYAAARAELVDQALRPALAAGAWVVLDRFSDSSLAYQGAGRGLGVGAVAAINSFATGDLVADRTLLLRIDPSVGRERQGAQDRVPDRLEREPGAFFVRVAAAYDALAAADPARIRVLDGAAPPAAALDAARAAIADLVATSAAPPSTAIDSRRPGASARAEIDECPSSD